jgi:tetratricopeptide (TPR) repeat protein
MSTKPITTGEPLFSTLDPYIECSLKDAQDCLMNGDYKAALKIYDAVIRKRPHDSRALHYKGNILDLMGLFSDAIQCYDHALTSDPDDAELWYNKGITLTKMGSHEDALFHIKKGLTLLLGY